MTILPKPLKILLIALTMVASLIPILCALKLDTPIDDAYITFVYARSLAHGEGFRAFPTASPTLGTTTPLTAFTLAALSRILPFADLKDIAVWLSVVAWIATGWLWALKGKAFGLSEIASYCIALIVLSETFLRIEHLGMEAQLFALLLTVCLVLYLEQRRWAAGVVAGLLFLTRGEGILIIPTLFAYEFLAPRKKNLLKAIKNYLPVIGGAAIVFGVWAVYALLAIGIILPSTLAAKTSQLELGFVEPFYQYTFKVLTRYWDNLGFLPLGWLNLSIWVVLAVAGISYSIRFAPCLLILLLWVALFVIGYSVLGVPGYHWYPLPFMYVITVFAGLAIAVPAELLGQTQRVWGLAATFAALFIVGVNIVPRNIPREKVIDDRNVDYKRIAEWLNTNTPVGSRAAFFEVGMLQWYSQREIVDLLGLMNPELLQPLKQGGYPLAFERGNVDNLIYMEPFQWGLQSIIGSPYFGDHYYLAARLSGTRFKGYPFLVYRRGTQPPPAASLRSVTLPLSMTSEITDLLNLSYLPDGSIQADAGPNPALMWKNLSVCAEDFPYLVVDMAVSEIVPGRIFRLSYSRSGQFPETQFIKIPIRSDAAAHTYLVDTSLLEGWSGNLSSVRLEPIQGINMEKPNEIVIHGFRLLQSIGPSHCAF